MYDKSPWNTGKSAQVIGSCIENGEIEPQKKHRPAIGLRNFAITIDHDPSKSPLPLNEEPILRQLSPR